MWSAEEKKNGKGGKYLDSQEHLGEQSSGATNIPDCWTRKLWSSKEKKNREGKYFGKYHDVSNKQKNRWSLKSGHIIYTKYAGSLIHLDVSVCQS